MYFMFVVWFLKLLLLKFARVSFMLSMSNEKHLKNATACRIPIHQVSLLLCDRGDRYGPIEWAQWSAVLLLIFAVN